MRNNIPQFNRLNISIVIGLVAISGILVAQLLWTKKAFTFEEKKFGQSIHIALLEVVKNLYEGTNHELPSKNPVVKVANDYYIVNVDNDFQPEILEFYLKTEFEKMNIATDFEYAMYNCQSDEMVYGNYVSFSDKAKSSAKVYFPKHKNLVYYFAVRFPNEKSYLLGSLQFWFVLSLALVVILLVYVYSIFTLLQQKKYSDLQRDFINNMTHEFKTPLSSILIASNYLGKQPVVTNDHKLKKYAQIIINQGNKLNNHIEKILHVAKSDHAPLQLNKTAIQLRSLLSEVAENIQLNYPEASITIQAEKDHVLLADAFHLTNIIYNLIDNAIKYCEDTPSIVIKITEENKGLKLQCIDNGLGISPKKLPFIFDKFYRIPNSKSTEVNGFGLGLYYVKKLTNLHLWRISAENNPDQGLTITIYIPLEK